MTAHAHDEAIPHVHGPRGPLLRTLVLTASFLVVEAVGGWLTGSLALLADAGHMLSDVAALGFSLFAAWMATRRPTHDRTYGYLRFEVVAGGLNGLALLVLSLIIAWSAAGRLGERPEIAVGPMVIVALSGLLVNLVGLWLLSGHQHENLNVRGAYLHVLGDLAGSVGALAAGVLMWWFGFTAADAIASLVIALLLAISAVRLSMEALNIVLEATPRGVDVGHVEDALTALTGVVCVHDVHVWTVSSGFRALSGHISIESMNAYDDVLVAAHSLLRSQFGIAHPTLQLETAGLESRLADIHAHGEAYCLPGHVLPEMAGHPH